MGRATTKLGLLALCVTAVGCGDPRLPPLPALNASFQGLKPTYALSDDTDPSTPGIQISVVVRGSDTQNAITLTGGSLTVSSDGDPAQSAHDITPVLAGDTATFPKVTVYTGANTLTAQVSDTLGSVARTSVDAVAQTRAEAPAPAVESVTFVGDSQGDGILNAAEQASGAPVAHVITSGLADGEAVTLTAKGDGSTVYGTATVAGNVADVSLDGLGVTGTTEGAYLLEVHLAGSAAPQWETALRVDRVGPQLTVSAPVASANIGIAQDADPLTTGVQVEVIASSTASDLALAPFALSGMPVSVSATPVVSGGQATFVPTVDAPDGADETFTVTAADSAGNLSTQSVTAYVKTAAPSTLSFVFAADANRDGVVNNAEQSTGPLTATITTQHASGLTVHVIDTDTSAEVGSGVVDAGGVASVTIAETDVAAGSNATFHFQLVMTDQAGNSNAQDPQALRTLTVARQAATISLVAPCIGGTMPCPTTGTIGVANDFDTSNGSFDFGLSVQVPSTGMTVTFTEVAGSESPGKVWPTTMNGITATTGIIASPAMTASAHYVVRIDASDGSGNTGTQTVDFTIPALLTGAMVTGGCPGGNCTSQSLVPATPVTVVAQQNSHFNPTPAAGFIANKNLGTGTADVDFVFLLAGMQGCQAQVELNGTLVGSPSTPLADNGARVMLFPDVPLAAKASGALGVRVFDGAGHQFSYTVPVTIDVISPAQTVTSVALALPSTGSPYDARRPSLDVSWSAAGDDGTSGGPVAGYDVRWSTDAILPPVNTGASGAPTWTYQGIDSHAKFLNQGQTYVQSVPGSPLPASATTVHITGIPAVGRYFAVVRGVDALGNYAPLPPIGQQMVADALSTKTLTTGASGNNLFGGYLQAGRLDSDAFADLVVLDSYNGSNPAVWVAKGAADPQTMSPVQLAVPSSTLDGTAGFFITDLSIGSASTPTNAANPVQDLVVSGNGWGSSRGRAVLYFGGPNAPSATAGNFVEFRGTTSGDRLGGQVRIIPDLNGDHYDEVLVPAWGENGRRGNVYLFFGRPAAAWSALATASDGSEAYIPVTNADRVLPGGPTGDRLIVVPAGAFSGSSATHVLMKSGTVVSVATFGTTFTGGTVTVASSDPKFASGTFAVTSASSTGFTYDDGQFMTGPMWNSQQVTLSATFNVSSTTVSANGLFGRGRGFAVIGDAITVPESLDYSNELFFYRRSDIGTALGGGAPVAVSSSILQPEPVSPYAASGSLQGFGYDAVGAQLVGSALPDLAVGDPLQSEVHLYPDPTAAAQGGEIVLHGNGRFGFQVAAPDLDGDGNADLAVATNNVGAGSNFLSGAFVFFGGGPLDTQAGAGFRQSRLLGDAASLASANAIGFSVAFGDFNGDGATDFAVADPASTNAGGQAGKVFVRY